jgi:hypothetical protein
MQQNITARGDKNWPPQALGMMEISKPIIAYRGFPLPASLRFSPVHILASRD